MTSSSPIDNPELRIVALASVIEHEFNDDQRTAPLIRRLQAEGLLKNPPLVVPLEAGPAGPHTHYVVIDGANRCTALGQLGYEHVLVQVVQYAPPQVTLSTWHHAVTGYDVAAFAQGVVGVPDLNVRETDSLTARADLARRDLIAYAVLADGRVLAARSASHSLHEQNRLLNAMVDTYKDHGALHRTIAVELPEARETHPDLTALVVFPNYEPAEVMLLARDGELLPPGLTRHLIQGRVLRTNYPLADLRSADSLEAKNARLQAWLQAKVAERSIRFYGEATFLFDE